MKLKIIILNPVEGGISDSNPATVLLPALHMNTLTLRTSLHETVGWISSLTPGLGWFFYLSAAPFNLEVEFLTGVANFFTYVFTIYGDNCLN